MEERKVGRELYWSELDEGKKIERMREVIKRLEERINCLTSIVEPLKRHCHIEGKVMVDIEDGRVRGYGNSSSRISPQSEVYF